MTLQSIFPNPVQNDITISFSVSAKGPVSYLITNPEGQMIMKKTEDLEYVGAYNKNWSLRGLPAGVYLMAIVSGNEKRTLKFAKQ